MGVLDEDWWRKLQLGEGIAPMDDVEPAQGMLQQLNAGIMGAPAAMKAPVQALRGELGKLPAISHDVAAAIQTPMQTLNKIRDALGETEKWRSTKSGATLPGDVYAGRQPMGLPSETEDLTRVADTLGFMGTGAFAPKKSAAGIFGGRLSQTADQAALKEAMRMAALKETPERIWQGTGWGRGADNQWRYEIPDKQAALRNFNPAKEMYAEGKLGDFLHHPELYAAHPDMAKIPLELERGFSAGGGYNPKGAQGGEGIGAYGPNTQKILSELIHESSHGVQARNNFTPGANPEIMRSHPEYSGLADKYFDTYTRLKIPAADARKSAREQALYDLYQRVAGEVEPRNAQTRQDWSPAKRRLVIPEVSEDIPRRNQILFGAW